MKITDLEIDGFGVWQGLTIANLSRRVTVFYGPNEAGKTTLMQFIRAVLYGVSPGRRKRYLPPVEGGQPGGALGIADGEMTFRANRIADRGPDDVGRVVCTTGDGVAGGDRLLREALADVDEATFTNVFAVGLDEVQELGTLSGSRAAEWIYRLTSGIDRVSLFDVIQQLGSQRSALLAPPGRASTIGDLSAERDRLRAEIDRLREQSRLWLQTAVKLKELDDEIARQESEVRIAEHGARTLEIAVGLKPAWRKREKLDEQLGHLTGRVKLPDDAVARLNSLNADIEKHQRQADVLAGQRRQLRDEADRLGINELLVRNAARIEALGEQRDWLESLERQRDDLDREAAQFESRLAAEQKRLAEVLGVKDAQRVVQLTENDLDGLQPHVDALRVAQKRVDAAHRDLEALAESERSLKTQIETAIIGGQSHKLPMDLDEAANLVAQLRKRLQIEQRLQQARQHEVELEQQSHDLLDDQVMPLWLFGWLLATFVVGALMLGVWALAPDSRLGQYGGLTALLGVGGAAFAWVFKYFADDAAAEKLDACQRQMDVVARQVADAEREKAAVDAELPMTDGSVVLRLQAAERHLAELENVLPVEAQRKQAGSEAANADARLRQAQRERDVALAAWRNALAGLGLPETLDSQRLAAVAERYGQLAELEARARTRREDAAKRRREHDVLLRRIHDLAEEVGCAPETRPQPSEKPAGRGAAGDRAGADAGNADALDQLDRLLAQRRRQLADVERREQLAVRARELKNEEAKHLHAGAALKRRRASMLQAAGCDDEQAYRMMAADQHQAVLLGKERDAVSREIAAAIGKHEPDDVFFRLLSPESIGALETQWEKAAAEWESRQRRLKELAEQRGELKREQSFLAKDRSLAERQLDLGVVERRLADAQARWREHAVVGRVLEQIRADYEAHRQPETLSEASRHLSQLTAGQYVRIWTPLARDILLVDTADGQSLPVEVLSRGTREQLFLSIRLALVATFARRGVNLPMVLDDVLVNFDVDRAQRAADVLVKFAEAGHQLLFFTCHEHVWEMFQRLDADCRRLPARKGLPAPAVVTQAIVDEQPAPRHSAVETRPTSKPAKKRPRRKPKPVPAPARVKDDWYDYPFVERLVAEVEAPSARPTVIADETPSWAEYSFESSATSDHPGEPAPALAYIVGSGDSLGESRTGAIDAEARRAVVGRTFAAARADGRRFDRFESRRA